jgi:hypothetical protein
LRSSLTTIQGWPGTYGLDRVHARTLRGSLASVRTKVDLSRIAALTLVTRGASGRVWVLDMAASQARIQVPAVLNLPVLSVETTTVTETDGLKRYSLKITTDQPLQSSASIWVQDSFSYEASANGYQLDLVPGSGTLAAEIFYDWNGDNLYSDSSFSLPVFIEAVKGVVTGDYTGTLNIVEDEPVPQISLVSSNTSAMEGQSLQWTLKLSSATAGTSIYFTVIAPSSGVELTTHDVATSWLISVGVFSPPSTPVPLSSLDLFIGVRFEYGMKSANLLVPISRDGRAEGDEVIVLQLVNGFDDVAPAQPLTLTGKVLAHN